MKQFGICILIIILLLAGFWFYMDNKCSKLQNEKDEAIAAAVASAIDSVKSHRALNPPPVRTHIVYVEKPAPKKKVDKTKRNVFTDTRDNQEYSFIDVDGTLWMADNLNYKSDDSYCYDAENAKCDNFGRLYTWKAATNTCPDGWRLPNDDDWKKLIWHNGGIEYAGKELKEGGESGFNALMAGYRDKHNFYGKVNESTYFWSSTEQNENYASFRGMYHNNDNIGPYTYTKADAFSVRCIKDEE
jgi:uncharacterized protein (TIGR02145 family)